jgi:ribonuclease P protein component
VAVIEFHEADLPTQETQALQDTRLPRAKFFPWRKGDTQAATQEGSPPPLCLTLATGRNQSRRGRLSRSADFDRVYRSGESKGNRYLVLHVFPRSADAEGPPRLGISVGKKVGNAVRRNRVKRVIREEFWALEDRVSDTSDYVVVARPDLGNLLDSGGSQALRAQIEELLPPPTSKEGTV